MAEHEPLTPTDLAGALEDALRILDERGEAELEAHLAAHPAAAQLRDRLRQLRESGMIGRADADREVPRRLGEFVLHEQLGRGGMGVVHRAFQPSLGRDVALKLVRPEHLYFEQARERFRREIEAVARLEHAGIVRVYAAGEDAGVPFFVMERVDGISLDRLLKTLRGRDPADLDERAVRRALRAASGRDAPGDGPRGARWSELCCRWMKDLALAVDHAHGHGVLHRDLKPSNVMVTPDLGVKLLDFGLASTRASSPITRTGSRLGSLPYMAPEQLGGGTAAVDERTDVYGLGVTFHELLTLRNPFLADGDTEEHTRRRILDGAPPVRRANPALSWDVETVCAVAMDPDPQRRYQSAADLARDLHNVLELRSIVARRPGPVRRLRRLAQRRPAWTVGLALGFLLVVVGPTAFALRERFAREAIARAQREAEAELETQEEILAFLTDDLLAAVAPDEVGRDASMREVLDTASRNVEAKFADRPHVEAAIRETIGSTYMHLGALAEAEPHLLRAVELFDEHRGPEHAHTLSAWRALAVLYRKQDRLTDAEAVGRRIVAVLESSCGPEHADTLAVKNNLGLALVHLARYDEAESLLSEVVESRLRSLGEHHRETLTSMANLGLVYYNSGRTQQAEHWWRRELAGSKAIFEPNHPDLLISLGNWANVQESLGRLDEVLSVRQDLVGRTEAVYGPRHPHTILALVNLATVLNNFGDRAAAGEAVGDALGRCAELPEDHDIALSARLLQAWVHARSGRADQALSAVDELLRIHRAADRPNPARIFEAERLRAHFLAQLGSWEEAEEQCRRAIDAAALAGATGPAAANAHFLHGRSLRHLGRHADAIDALARVEALLRETAPRSRLLLNTYDERAAVYDAWEKPAEAEASRRAASEWREAQLTDGR